MLAAPVQADRTGDTIRADLPRWRRSRRKKPVNAEELNRVIDGNIRSLPGSFETNGQVVCAMIRNELLGRPDNFYTTLASRYRAIDAKQINAMAAAHLQPGGLTFVVVWDTRAWSSRNSRASACRLNSSPHPTAAVDSRVSNAR